MPAAIGLFTVSIVCILLGVFPVFPVDSYYEPLVRFKIEIPVHIKPMNFDNIKKHVKCPLILKVTYVCWAHIYRL